MAIRGILLAVFSLSLNLTAADVPVLSVPIQVAIEKLVKEVERATYFPLSCNGRLTLTTDTPVTTADVTGVSTVYFTPYNGNKIALYDGSNWLQFDFTQKSVAPPGNTNKPFDVFGYISSNDLALETVAWTNDTTRATNLTTQDGVWVKSGAATRRYLGTGRTTGSSGQTEDSKSRRFIWNACNRVARALEASGLSSDWTYTTATWRSANANTTTGTSRVEFVLGKAIEVVRLHNYFPAANGSTSYAVGIGLDVTNANSAGVFGRYDGPAKLDSAEAFYTGNPAEGGHFAQMIEISVASGSTYWNASSYGVAALTGVVYQ